MRGLYTNVANDSTRSLIGHVCGIQHGHCWEAGWSVWSIPHKNKYVEEMIGSYLGPVYMKVGDPR